MLITADSKFAIFLATKQWKSTKSTELVNEDEKVMERDREERRPRKKKKQWR